jgi:hypothetical protein
MITPEFLLHGHRCMTLRRRRKIECGSGRYATAGGPPAVRSPLKLLDRKRSCNDVLQAALFTCRMIDELDASKS